MLRHLDEVFGSVASAATCCQALDEIGPARLRRIAKARAKVRARVWALMGQPPTARAAAGRDIDGGVIVLDVYSTIVLAYSDKEGAAATYKHTFGFHPILVTCDNSGELLAITLRPGNAGAKTAADYLQVLGEAFTQVPATHRRRMLIRGDSAAATHAVLDWLHEQDHKRGRQVEYSTVRTPRVFVQSFEAANLRALRAEFHLRAPEIFLTSTGGNPFNDPRSYADYLTPAGLTELATFVNGIGPDKLQIIPRNADGTLGSPTSLVANAHAAGLALHPYTFRAENNFLPVDFRVGTDPTGYGRAIDEQITYLRAGIDGLFTDQADIGVLSRQLFLQG